MKQRGGGAIVMIASIWGRESGGRMTYNAVKAAEISLAKSLAQQLAPLNIRVNSVAPGSILFPGRLVAQAPAGRSRRASPTSSSASCRSAASAAPTKSAPSSRSSPRRAPAGSAARRITVDGCQCTIEHLIGQFWQSVIWIARSPSRCRHRRRHRRSMIQSARRRAVHAVGRRRAARRRAVPHAAHCGVVQVRRFGEAWRVAFVGGAHAAAPAR